MTISAVAFDMDGTLYPYRMMYAHSVPLFLRYPRFVYHFGRVRLELRRTPPVTDFRRAQAQLLARRLGVGPERAYELIQRIIYGEWVDSLRGIRPHAFLREALVQLRERGLKLAVLSDYPVKRKLGYLGLEGVWDCSFSCEETGYLKPHPKSFHRLRRSLDVQPERILYVGDIYEYDVVGARCAGMRTAYLCRRGCRPADIRFASYRDFARLVFERFN